VRGFGIEVVDTRWFGSDEQAVVTGLFDRAFSPRTLCVTGTRIFKIDRPFVERMRARGLKDLTVASLIKIKIFKLED
jgi:hypothetical protein